MIRKLTQKDQEKVLTYLYQASAYNIFIIGDIETFGMDTEFQRVYGEFDERGDYLSVFLRYRENAVYYAHETRFNLMYLEIFEKDPFEYLSGKTELLLLIEPYLKGYTKKHMYFCKADRMKEEVSQKVDIKEVKTKEDAIKLYDLLISIDEFGYAQKDKETFITQKTTDQKMGITLIIEKDDLVLSTVATTAETTKSAMVVAVATHKDYRNKGYASILMTRLMHIYIYEKQKELCLFYDNPEAGKIYHKLGFETIGTWDMFKRLEEVKI